MTSKPTEHERLALNDPDRRGILIPTSQLEGTGLQIGDRFVLKKGQLELFAVLIVRDDKGHIIFDKKGIFIERTRRIDMLMGGIFDSFQVEILADKPTILRVKPIGLNMESVEKLQS